MPAPIGPIPLYWAAWLEGRDAYRSGALLVQCPYGDDRAYSGEAWRDGWRETAARAGVPMPSDAA
jgi:hypothetical protein